MNRKEMEKIVLVQAGVKELRILVEDGEEMDGEWCSFDLLPPPMFTGKIFNFWVIRMLNFIRTKDLIEYQSNNPYDEVCDALLFDFIKHTLDDKFFYNVEKTTSSQEAQKILK